MEKTDHRFELVYGNNCVLVHDLNAHRLYRRMPDYNDETNATFKLSDVQQERFDDYSRQPTSPFADFANTRYAFDAHEPAWRAELMRAGISDPNATTTDTRGDGFTDLQKAMYLSGRCSDFRTHDSNNNGIPDMYEFDSDSDGLLDGQNLVINTTTDPRYDLFMHPHNYSVGTHYFNNMPIIHNDNGNGTYTFYGEMSMGTDPLMKDSDLDGLNDTTELFTVYNTTYRSAEHMGASAYPPVNITASGTAAVYINNLKLFRPSAAVASVGITSTNNTYLKLYIGNTHGTNHEKLVDNFTYAAGKTYDIFNTPFDSSFTDDLSGNYTWYLKVVNTGTVTGTIDSFELAVSAKTDPNNPDTDNDGLTDGAETAIWTTTVNGVERNVTSSPINPDTDSDGLTDTTEYNGWDISVTFEQSTSPPVATTVHIRTNPNSADSDSDGLTDYQEKNGASGWNTNATASDTDYDGLMDGNELFMAKYGTSKKYIIPDNNTATDGFVQTDPFTVACEREPDTAEAWLGIVHPHIGDLRVTLRSNGTSWSWSNTIRVPDANNNASNNFTSLNLLSPSIPASTFTMGYEWWAEVSDTVNNSADFGNQTQYIEYFELHLMVKTNSTDYDSDNDGLNDSEEITLGADGYITNPWSPYTDSDGVSDGQEFNVYHSDPTKGDTDGDGATDSNDLDPLRNVMLKIRINGLSNATETADFFGVSANFNYGANNQSQRGFYTSVLDQDYTLDVPDDYLSSVLNVSFSAWHDNGDNTDSALNIDHYTSPNENTTLFRVFFNLYSDYGSYSFWSDGDATEHNNFLHVTIAKVSDDPINTIMLNSTSGQELYKTPSGEYRYTGEQQYYVFILNVTGCTNSTEYFVNGYNAIIVPRGVFSASYMYSKFVPTCNVSNLPDFMKNLTFGSVRSNDSSVSKFDGVVVGTYTTTSGGYISAGDAATLITDWLMKNASGNATARALNVTGESYDAPLAKLNLNHAILGMIPFMDLPFGATHNAPRAEKSWWDVIVGTFTGAILSALQFIGNLVLAGLQLIANFAVWLYHGAMWLWGVISGAAAKVAQVVAAAAKALADALNFVLTWITNTIQSLINSFIQGLKEQMRNYAKGISNTLTIGFNEYNSTGNINRIIVSQLDNLLGGNTFIIVTALVVAIVGLSIALTPFPFILIPISILIVGLFIYAIWNTVCEQIGNPPSISTPNISIGMSSTDIANVIKNSLGTPSNQDQKILGYIGFILGLSGWFAMLVAAGTISITDVSGGLAFLGAAIFSLLGLGLGLVAQESTNPNDKSFISLFGMYFSIMGIICSTVIFTKMWQIVPWGTASMVLSIAGFAISKAGVIC